MTQFTLPFTLDAGTLPFTIPAGQQILGAVFTSTFGNSTVPDTAIMDVFVNGIKVGACASMTDPCWTDIFNPTPFSYTFTSADLSALSTVSADLTIEQLDCCVIRLGESTLTITTGIADDSPVSAPEPASLLLLGPGLLALGVLRKRRALKDSHTQNRPFVPQGKRVGHPGDCLKVGPGHAV